MTLLIEPLIIVANRREEFGERTKGGRVSFLERIKEDCDELLIEPLIIVPTEEKNLERELKTVRFLFLERIKKVGFLFWRELKRTQ